MGVYYNPVTDITNGIVAVEYFDTYNYNDAIDAIRQLPHRYHLYALCSDLMGSYAVCVDKESEFNEFFGQYNQGHLISFQLIAILESAHKRGAIELMQI